MLLSEYLLYHLPILLLAAFHWINSYTGTDHRFRPEAWMDDTDGIYTFVMLSRGVGST